MYKTLKFVFLAAFVAIGISSPVLAAGYDGYDNPGLTLALTTPEAVSP